MGLAITNGLFSYLRISNKEYDFEIHKPVPHKDPIYDKPLDDVHIIFNELEADVMVQKKGIIDVVTDGNQPLGRPLCADEKRNLKRLQGAPKRKQNKKRGEKKGRCIKVSAQEKICIARTRTGGLFATVSMNPTHNGQGNQILQLGEMKNSECKAYKIEFNNLRTNLGV